MPNSGKVPETEEEGGGTDQGGSGGPTLIPRYIARAPDGRDEAIPDAPSAIPPQSARKPDGRTTSRVWPKLPNPEGVEVFEITVDGVSRYEVLYCGNLVANFDHKEQAVREAAKMDGEENDLDMEAGAEQSGGDPEEPDGVSAGSVTPKI